MVPVLCGRDMETLVRHFQELTKAAFARHGFAYAELLAQWPAVVGEELARVCEPERIRWPRAEAGARKQGGVLVVRAAAGRALELQHEAPRIVERINGFYGYGAIAALKIVSAPEGPAFRRTAPQEPPMEEPPADPSASPLESALARLEAGLRRG